MKKKSFTIRLDLSKEGDKQAWNHLEAMDKQKYRSYSQLVSLAINQFFEEKEEVDLLPEIRKIIQEEVGKIQVVSVEKIQENEEENLAESNSEQDYQKAMDFIDSF